jgi:DNA-binding XRE family transcriptional regulator
MEKNRNEKVVLSIDLWKLRKDAGIKLEAAVAVFGIPKSTYGKFENGGIPSLGHALRVSRALKTPVEKIWTLEKKKSGGKP